MGLSLIAASLPLVIALSVALRPAARPRGSIDDYFLFQRCLTPDLFLKTSVGYSLQVASIFLFLFWTLTYGAVALFVPIAWALGYFLIYLAVRFGILDEFLGTSGERIRTIHGFVAKDAGERRMALVRVMAFATVAGLGGTLIAEIDYASTFILAALGFSSEAFPYADESIHVAVLLFTGCYVLWGGYRAVVLTDELQVPLSYASFCIVLISVCALSFKSASSLYAATIAASTAVLLLIFLVTRIKLIQNTPALDQVLLGGLATGAAIVALATALGTASGRNFEFSFFFPPHQESGYFLGFGFFGVVSLGLANALWQFVDISSLQRLQSVKFDPTIPQSRDTITKGLCATGVEASGVWVLVVFLGFALKAQGVASYDDVSAFFAGLQGPSMLLLPTIVFTYVVFMISTADGFISAMSFVAYQDIHGSGRPGLDQESVASQLRSPRWTTVATIFVVYVLYLVLKWGTERIDQILYAIYAVQLSIFPVIFARLFWPRRVSIAAGIASIIVGASCAVFTALTEPRLGIPPDSWYVIPPLASLLGAGTTYMVLSFGMRGRS